MGCLSFFFHDGNFRFSWWHTTIRSTNAEERLINTALLPSPRRDETAHSRLTRLAQGYGLTADRLLGHLLRAHNSTFCLECAFVAPHVNVLSKATRIPRRTWKRLQGASI